MQDFSAPTSPMAASPAGASGCSAPLPEELLIKLSAFMASIAISLLSCLSWVFCFFATDSSKESLFKGKL